MGKQETFFLPTVDPWLVAALNSPLMWWHNWRHLTHLKDEALSPMGYKVEVMPIAAPKRKGQVSANEAVALLLDHTRASFIATSTTLDWLRHQFEIVKPGRDLSSVTALSADEFVTAVRNVIPRKRKLTAAEIAELTREHAATVEPARRARAQMLILERKLSDLVNEAYGLTPEEVALMWRTAPPRMPFTPAGLPTSDIAEAADGEEDQE